jgi:5-methylcytosine-specific restriction endonuclease McrBC GTP-binding regulatory subunit McrB
VETACNSYGLHFHPRLLKAFHTALKTAEWSPITILAGVSGTGKSELPRLYSHFGGLMFEPVSVQPNWDSQESMLGFFNSIDNKFDAQPILRFLAQSQKKWIDKTDDNEGYPGLQDMVCLVLLDEMNLAHPELYFAEFLSKLELRRGMKGTDVPTLPVKIGAGMPAYQLPLGRNVLWVGTMNQDETTKALSDKVLDRSIIIYFPRPTTLERRLALSPLDEKNRGQLLHKASWQTWLAQGSSFTEEEIKPFKCFIEDMNKSLAVAGRAIGHRVWQSVEYYLANYPDVRAAKRDGDKDALAKALHIAFEDQLVQKVMPKLRGIDTRGKTMTECIEKIRDQINLGIGGNPFNLAEDFNLACELGYGQFIWQSANYLLQS